MLEYLTREQEWGDEDAEVGDQEGEVGQGELDGHPLGLGLPGVVL